MVIKQIKTVENLRWTYGGTLTKPKYVQGGGVYLLVYEGKWNRIIYVGTTLNFENRWNEHIGGIYRGNRTIWRVSSDQDIYDLMSYHGYRDYFKYYRNLALNNLLWASTTILKINNKNDLNDDDHFQDNWLEYTEKYYMPRIHLWACRMNERMEFSTILESQIQRALRKNFHIGSHINKPDMSWLGKIEHLDDDIFKIKFNFQNLPLVDEITKKILTNLTEKKISKYQKVVVKKETKNDREKKRNQLRKIRKKYPMAYFRWIPKEEQILLFLMEKQISFEEMSVFLQRTPEEIERKLTNLSVTKIEPYL